MIKSQIIKFEQNLCSRRDFIVEIAKKVSYLTVGSYVISQFNACSDGSNPISPNQKNPIMVDLSLFENSALNIIGGSVAISGNNIDESGMLIIRTGESLVTALSRTCTHQGCTIPGFQNGVSSCPCHGSRFDTSGNVVNGPATTALKKYNATIVGNIITING